MIFIKVQRSYTCFQKNNKKRFIQKDWTSKQKFGERKTLHGNRQFYDKEKYHPCISLMNLASKISNAKRKYNNLILLKYTVYWYRKLFWKYLFKEMHFCWIGCKPGHFDVNCSQRCIYPTYGVKCRNYCSCEKKFCNFSFGCSTRKTTLGEHVFLLRDN